MVMDFDSGGGGGGSGETDEERRERERIEREARERAATPEPFIFEEPPSTVAAPPFVPTPAPAREPFIFEEPATTARAPVPVPAFQPATNTFTPAPSRAREPFIFEEPVWETPAPAIEDFEEEPFGFGFETPAPSSRERVPFIFEEPETPAPDEMDLWDAAAQTTPPAPIPFGATFFDQEEYSPATNAFNPERVEAAKAEGLASLFDYTEAPVIEGISEPEPAPRRMPLFGLEETEGDTGGPSLVPSGMLESLASLPDLDRFATGSETTDTRIQQGAADQGMAREIVGLRDDLRTPLTMDDIATLFPNVDRENPENLALLAQKNAERAAGADLTQSEMDRISRQMAVQQVRRDTLTRLGESRQARSAVDVQVPGSDYPIRGIIRDGVFVPERSVFSGDEAAIVTALREAGRPVSGVSPTSLQEETSGAQSENEGSPLAYGLRVLREAATLPLGTGLTFLGAMTTGLAIPADVASRASVIAQMAVKGWALDHADRVREVALGNDLRMLGLPGTVLRGAALMLVSDRSGLAQEFTARPRTEQFTMADSVYSAWAFGRGDEMAADLKAGTLSATQIREKYYNPWVDAAHELVVDPLNFATAAADVIRAARGMTSATSVINLDRRIAAEAFSSATARLGTKNAVEPWKALPILGRSASSRRDASVRFAETVTGHVQQIADHIGVENVAQYLEDLKVLGAEGTAAKWNLAYPTEAMQHTRMIAGELAGAAAQQGTELNTALTRGVYAGDVPWAQLDGNAQRAATKGKDAVYPSAHEKMVELTDALNEQAKVAARVNYGLAAKNDPARLVIQDVMRQSLSKLYLAYKPAYHIRNALGDLTTALFHGTSAARSGNWVRQTLEAFGEHRSQVGQATIDFGGGGGQPKNWNIVGRLQGWVAKQEGARRDTLLATYLERLYPQFRNATLEQTRALLSNVPPEVQRDLERIAGGARSARDLSFISPRAGNFRAGFVLGELDDGTMPAATRTRLDTIAQYHQQGRADLAQREIDALVREQMEHTNTVTGQYAAGVRVTPEDARGLAQDINARVETGMPRAQAQAEVLGAFAERHNNAVRVAQTHQELAGDIARVPNGRLSAQLAAEEKALSTNRGARVGALRQEKQARIDAITAMPHGPERAAAWKEMNAWAIERGQALAKQSDDELEAFAIKVRRVSTDPDVAGAAAKGARGKDAPDPITVAIAEKERRLAEAKASLGTAAPEGREEVVNRIRDLEEEVANLHGKSTIDPPTHPAGEGHPLGATTTAAENMQQALLALAFRDRLDGAAAQFAETRAAYGKLTPEQARDIARYQQAHRELMLRDREGTRAAAGAMTNFILHNYKNTNDADWWLRWVSPWELWTTRTFGKTLLRMADHPAYFANMQILRDALHESTAGRPDFLRDKIKTPVGFLPDWVGDQLFSDPVKAFIPTEMLSIYQGDLKDDSAKGRAKVVTSLAHVGLGPVVDTALAMAGGASFWETQRRNPVADGWGAVALAANKVGIPMPYSPITTARDLADARRQVAMGVVTGEWSVAEAREANNALDQYVQTGFRLRGQGLENEQARTALDRAQARVATAGVLSSGFAILAPTFSAESERKLKDLQDQYFTLRDADPTEAKAKAFLKEHPELPFWWQTGMDQDAHHLMTVNSQVYDARAAILKERDAELAKLPMFGTDVDRERVRREYQGKIDALYAAKEQEVPGWDRGRVAGHQSLTEEMADRLFDLPVPRDSNGVRDWDQLFKQQADALKAAEAMPEMVPDGTGGFTPGSTVNLRPEVEDRMVTKNAQTATKSVIEGLYLEARAKQSEEASKAKTREEASRIRQAFEAKWQTPDPLTIADAVEAKFPGRFDQAAVLRAIDASVPVGLTGFAQLNEAERVQRFMAGLNEQGKSDEPFYVDKNNGVSPIVVQTQADLTAWQKAKEDDKQYQARRAANDPTYAVYDTEARQRWLFGGEAGATLWRTEQAVLTQALGPMDPATGQRLGGKGWTSEFRFPDGTKQKAIEAYQAVNKWQDELSAKQTATPLPSERANTAQTQTAASNAAAKTTAAKTGGTSGTRTNTRTTGSGTARSTGTNRGVGSSVRTTAAPVDRGPTVPAVKWINDGVLTKAALTGTDRNRPGAITDLREEWRLGLGLTPEKYDSLLGRHPDLLRSIEAAESMHAGINAEGADQNGITRAIQEQALRVQMELEKAKAGDAERIKGPLIPDVRGITDSQLAAAQIRQGKTDFAAAFRAGTGLAEDKWASFLQRNPDVQASLAALQEQAGTLKTDDEVPDDAEALKALYENAIKVSDRIQAGAKADAERAKGVPLPGNVLHISDAMIAVTKVRNGTADLERGFRTGSSKTDAEWATFLAAHPDVQQAIAEAQTAASGLKTEDQYPDDAAALSALYDRVIGVSSLITAAKQADAEKKADETRAANDARNAATRAKAEADRAARQRPPTSGGTAGGSAGGSGGRSGGSAGGATSTKQMPVGGWPADSDEARLIMRASQNGDWTQVIAEGIEVPGGIPGGSGGRPTRRGSRGGR